MKATYHPDGTSQLSYCPRHETAMIGKLKQFSCIQGSGTILNPLLCRECSPITAREVRRKISQAFEQHGNTFQLLGEVVAATTGIKL